MLVVQGRVFKFTYDGQSVQETEVPALRSNVFTGEDTNSTFKGKRKVSPLKKLEKKPRYQATFECLGESWIVSADVTNELKKITCEMYGYHRLSSVDQVHAAMIKKMVGDAAAITHSSKIDPSTKGFRHVVVHFYHTSSESIIGLHNESILILTLLIYQHQQNMDGRSIKETWSLFGLRGLFCR